MLSSLSRSSESTLPIIGSFALVLTALVMWKFRAPFGPLFPSRAQQREHQHERQQGGIEGLKGIESDKDDAGGSRGRGTGVDEELAETEGSTARTPGRQFQPLDLQLT